MTSRREVSHDAAESFSGDDEIDSAIYRRIMSGGYVSTTMYLASAAEALDVYLDAVTEERWRRLVAASYYIDEYVDTAADKQEAHEQYEIGMRAVLDRDIDSRVIESLYRLDQNELLLPSIRLLYNSIADISPEALYDLRRAALAINDIALEKSQTSDITTYIDLLNEEASATVRLLDRTVDPSTKDQPEYERLHQVVGSAMSVAVYIDSAIDLKDDYEEGITQVPPTIRHIGKLALQAASPARELTRLNGSFRAGWQMMRQVRPYVTWA